MWSGNGNVPAFALEGKSRWLQRRDNTSNFVSTLPFRHWRLSTWIDSHWQWRMSMYVTCHCSMHDVLRGVPEQGILYPLGLRPLGCMLDRNSQLRREGLGKGLSYASNVDWRVVERIAGAWRWLRIQRARSIQLMLRLLFLYSNCDQLGAQLR